MVTGASHRSGDRFPRRRDAVKAAPPLRADQAWGQAGAGPTSALPSVTRRLSLGVLAAGTLATRA